MLFITLLNLISGAESAAMTGRAVPLPYTLPSGFDPVAAKQKLSSILANMEVPKEDSFQRDCLALHNKYRAILGLGPLSWSDSISSKAQEWANSLASRNAFQHSGSGAGENLYQTTNGDTSCSAAVKAWFDEYKVYNGEPIGRGNFHDYGHFTQLIWPATKSVGCGYKKQANGKGYKQTIVCQYLPAGNVVGQSVSYTPTEKYQVPATKDNYPRPSTAPPQPSLVPKVYQTPVASIASVSAPASTASFSTASTVMPSLAPAASSAPYQVPQLAVPSVQPSIPAVPYLVPVVSATRNASPSSAGYAIPTVAASLQSQAPQVTHATIANNHYQLPSTRVQNMPEIATIRGYAHPTVTVSGYAHPTAPAIAPVDKAPLSSHGYALPSAASNTLETATAAMASMETSVHQYNLPQQSSSPSPPVNAEHTASPSTAPAPHVPSSGYQTPERESSPQQPIKAYPVSSVTIFANSPSATVQTASASGYPIPPISPETSAHSDTQPDTPSGYATPQLPQSSNSLPEMQKTKSKCIPKYKN